MDKERAWLVTEKYNGIESPEFFTDCERLEAGEPLAYVIGSIPFLDTTIYLDSCPLIPRPETEYWVHKAIKTIHDSGLTTSRVLDLCAGSGAIGVAVLKAIPDVMVDFAEIDERHHATIRKNIEANGIAPTRTHIYGGDLFQHIDGRYDFILANPPYIDPALGRTETSVKDFEPHQALYGGIDGIEIIHRIIEDTPLHLIGRGVLFMEHEPEQAEYIARLHVASQFSVTSLPDQYGVIRYSILQRLKK